MLLDSFHDSTAGHETTVLPECGIPVSEVIPSTRDAFSLSVKSNHVVNTYVYLLFTCCRIEAEGWRVVNVTELGAVRTVPV